MVAAFKPDRSNISRQDAKKRGAQYRFCHYPRYGNLHLRGDPGMRGARCQGDPLEAAYQKFVQLGMEDTRLRNGVLIYGGSHQP